MASKPRSVVKLVSAEGFEFIIDYKAACVSNTIRNMLSSQGAHVLVDRGPLHSVRSVSRSLHHSHKFGLQVTLPLTSCGSDFPSAVGQAHVLCKLSWA
jgi:hypothetical protein